MPRRNGKGRIPFKGVGTIAAELPKGWTWGPESRPQPEPPPELKPRAKRPHIALFNAAVAARIEGLGRDATSQEKAAIKQAIRREHPEWARPTPDGPTY